MPSTYKLTNIVLLLCALLTPTPSVAGQFPNQSNLFKQDYFPVGVWLQSPASALRFKELGINLYVGLWGGPTREQLNALNSAEMPVICSQNEEALSFEHQDIIEGWLQQDEPDNAQPRKVGIFYNPPVLPAKIQQSYVNLKKLDRSRPVLLNLGQGVAWDGWHGRGERTKHPEDYVEYVKGGDIISFDIYPVTHKNPEIRGRLEYVARGVQRLDGLIAPEQRVWNVIGASRINDPETLPKPAQVRSQVWMSIIHGSRGIIYFVHQFKPKFIEAAVFDDKDMMVEMKQLNKRLQEMASIINSPNSSDIKQQTTANPDVPIAAVTKRDGNQLYLLSVAMRGKATAAQFEFDRSVPDQLAEVLDEDRTVPVRDGILEDLFKPYEAHIYRIGTGQAK